MPPGAECLIVNMPPLEDMENLDASRLELQGDVIPIQQINRALPL